MTKAEIFVRSGDVASLARLLRDGLNPNDRDAYGGSLLALAISAWETNHHQLETCRLLLQAGANPNFCGDDGCDLVLSAIFTINVDIVELLLRSGADPNAITDDGETLFDAASFDYQYQQYGIELLPEPASDLDTLTEDTWLQMLDRFASKYGQRAPTELHALRRYGARRRGSSS